MSIKIGQSNPSPYLYLSSIVLIDNTSGELSVKMPAKKKKGKKGKGGKKKKKDGKQMF